MLDRECQGVDDHIVDDRGSSCFGDIDAAVKFAAQAWADLCNSGHFNSSEGIVEICGGWKKLYGGPGLPC